MTKEEKRKLIKRLYKERGVEVDHIDDTEFEVIEQYTSIQCKEQREICAREATVIGTADFVAGVNKESIINAPCP